MTDYPLTLNHRDHYGNVRIEIPVKIGVPEVDAQLDLLEAVQKKNRLAVEREREAEVRLRDLRNAASVRLMESMSEDGEPDLSGDAEVTTAELTLNAAKRITKASSDALANEVRRFFDVMGEHQAEVRSVLWKRAEKARDTLTGAAFAADQAYAQLRASAGMVAGLDALSGGRSMSLAPAHFRGNVEASVAVEKAREALVEVNAFLDDSWQPAPKKETEAADTDLDDDFAEVD